mgnify:FL=1
MNKCAVLSVLVVVSTAITVLPAFGQNEGAHGYLAVGAGALPEYEGADSQQVIPFLAGRAQWGQRYIAIEGVSARANVLASSAWEAGPLASITFGRDADIESAAVARLPTLDDSIELGAFVAYSWSDVARDGDTLRLETRAIGDVSDVYGGWQSSISAGYATPIGERVRLSLDFSTTLVSDDYAEAYFSVAAPGAAASGLPTYRAEGGLKDVGVGVGGSYAFNGRWSLNGFAGYRRLLGDAADSPIVDGEGSPDQFSAGLGVGFSF